MIDLTLDRLKRPAITGLVPNFGTTVEVTEKNKGGLSTTEVDANMALAYELQREVNVSTSDTTSIVEHEAKVALIGDETITLTLQGASYGGCELKITNRGSQTATILYNEGASIQIPPRGYLRFIWTLQDWWVEQRRNPQEDGGNIQTYTYVVDSDQALIDWANNDRNRGQDYTSVLIKKGEWKSNKGVNLTQAGTLAVEGEIDSTLVFNFDFDFNLDVACITGYAEMHGITGVYITGFASNDVAEIETTVSVTGFKQCYNLIGCDAKIDVNNAYNYGDPGQIYATSYGYHKCKNIVNCSGASSAEQVIQPSGTVGLSAVFSDCTLVSRCKAGSHTDSVIYRNSFASNTENYTYACADTANGGFNDTTNPPPDTVHLIDSWTVATQGETKDLVIKGGKITSQQVDKTWNNGDYNWWILGTAQMDGTMMQTQQTASIAGITKNEKWYELADPGLVSLPKQVVNNETFYVVPDIKPYILVTSWNQGEPTTGTGYTESVVFGDRDSDDWRKGTVTLEQIKAVRPYEEQYVTGQVRKYKTVGLSRTPLVGPQFNVTILQEGEPLPEGVSEDEVVRTVPMPIRVDNTFAIPQQQFYLVCVPEE